MTRDPNTESGGDHRADLARAIADGDKIDWSIESTASGIDPREMAAYRALSCLRGAASPASPGPFRSPSAARAVEGPFEQGYEIISELGRGSFGAVWLARDRALDREVALKVVREDRFADADARDRFLREARILAKMKHSNIVRIHSVDEADGKLRLSLERVTGVTFDQYVRENGPLDANTVARVAVDLCGALAELHAAGLVHGDLKPSNVMRTPEGRTVLLDFGIARDPSADATPDGLAIPQGTPLYMAPEVFDQAVPDGRADLYALGAMLHFLLTGSIPFPGADPVTIRAMQSGVASLDAKLANTPRPLREFVKDCLAENRSRRPADAIAAELRLRHFLATGVRRRNLVAMMLAAAVVVAATVLGMKMARKGVLAADFLRHTGSVEQRLRDGDSVTAGDRLTLDFEVDRDTWVYVFNEDDHGAVSSLFPLEGVTPGRPLPAGRHRLPGKRNAAQQEWILGAGGAAEFFVVLAAKEPIAAAEALERELSTPPVDPTLVADAGDVRGVKDTRAATPDARAAAPSFAGTRLEALLAACRDVDGVEIRKLALRRGDR